MGLRKAVDTATVRELQLRAPAASRRDRRCISSSMQNKTIFATVDNEQDRRHIEAAILRFQHLVPTVETLFKNLGYLEIGAKILKQEIIDSTPRMTVRRAILANCTMDDNSIPVENSEGDFVHYRVTGPDQARVLALEQLWLFCMRHFPHLGNATPKKRERTRGSSHPGDQSRL